MSALSLTLTLIMDDLRTLGGPRPQTRALFATFIHSVRYRQVNAKTSTPLFSIPKNLHVEGGGGGLAHVGVWDFHIGPLG